MDLRGYDMGKSDVICLEILKPRMTNWAAQYLVQMADQILPYSMRILRALDDVIFQPSTCQNWPRGRKLEESC